MIGVAASSKYGIARCSPKASLKKVEKGFALSPYCGDI